MNSSLWIAAGLAFCATVVALTQLPHQAKQTAHHGAHHGVAVPMVDVPMVEHAVSVS